MKNSSCVEKLHRLRLRWLRKPECLSCLIPHQWRASSHTGGGSIEWKLHSLAQTCPETCPPSQPSLLVAGKEGSAIILSSKHTQHANNQSLHCMINVACVAMPLSPGHDCRSKVGLPKEKEILPSTACRVMHLRWDVVLKNNELLRVGLC